MGEHIGIIQTRGLGDIIIALPIADALMDTGAKISWPVDIRFVGPLRAARPDINFLPVYPGAGYFYDTPHAMLKELGCERVLPLYNFLSERPVAVDYLARSLKFDEYKYAVAGVPFERKWRLRFQRDAERERRLHESLQITRPYICTHLRSGESAFALNLPPEWLTEFQIVEISEATDNPFDWTYTLENASKLILLDSFFANLVEQLNLRVEKYLIFRSIGSSTPVFKNGWTFLASGHPMIRPGGGALPAELR